MTRFEDVKIGSDFHDGIFTDSRGKMQYETYVKVSPTAARCIDQVGYGNKRMVGCERRFVRLHLVGILQT